MTEARHLRSAGWTGHANAVLGKSAKGYAGGMDRPHSRYLDIAAELRERIHRGVYAPGANLPRMQDLAAEFEVNRDTIGRAITVLESEGLVWAVPRRGTQVRYGMSRPRRLRGNLVKRNVATDSPGYSFPCASGKEAWVSPCRRPRGPRS